jgi:hypothetical protein
MPTPPTSPLRRAWIAFLIVGTIAYYFWTGLILPGGPQKIHGNEPDHFNLLSRGLLKGQLHLDQEVPAGLLQAKNPYDPVVRQSVIFLHDSSLYDGKYYIYFGPAPVVTLLLPFRALTGRDLPLPYAVWLYCSVGYLGLAAIVLFLQRNHFPTASLWTITAALLAVGWASMVLALLRRGNVWELSIAAGFGFFSWSLYCLIRALHAPQPNRWAIAGGLLLGLAVASRPTFILCSVLFALPWIFRKRSPQSGYDGRTVFGAAASCAIPVLLLFVYNYARFGNPLEFGQKYQLSGIIEGDAQHFSLRYIPFNFYVYFLAPLRRLVEFPFVSGIDLPAKPPGFGEHEHSFGLFTNVPVALIGSVAIAGLFRWRRGAAGDQTLWLATLAIAGAAVIKAAILISYFGNCIRYMADFTPYIMLLAAIGAFGLEARSSETVWRRWLGAGLLTLTLYSSFMAAAGVVHLYDLGPNGPPRRYRPIARALNVPALWVKQLRWPGFAPREIELALPADRSPREENVVTVKQHDLAVAEVFVEYVDATHIRFGYRETPGARPTAYSLPIVAASPRHVLRLAIGGAGSEFDEPGGRLRGEFDGKPFWDAPVVSFAAYRGELNFGVGDRSRFTGALHAIREIDFPAATAMPFAGARVRIAVTPNMADYAYPLLTTGRTKRGDILIVRVHEGRRISFAYDHWGHPLELSPEKVAIAGETCVVEFWAPALAPPGRADELIVKVDGKIAWRRPAPAFAIAPENVFFGTNYIGGSTCENKLLNAVFEDVRLPWPER